MVKFLNRYIMKHLFSDFLLIVADRAQRYFIDHFIDPQYGGVYWLIKADGTSLNADKQTYGCSYAIYGLSEHFRATGNNESLQKAIKLLI